MMKTLQNKLFSRVKNYLFLYFFVLLSATSMAQAPINFPIEVFIDKSVNENYGYSDPISINLSGTANYIYLRVNNLNDDVHMRYSIDGSAYETITPDYTGFASDGAYRGLGGGFGTVRFHTPKSISSGSHTIQFRYDYSRTPDPVYLHGNDALGYRIIDMDFRASIGGGDLLNNTKEEENPGNWTAPAGSNASDGEKLWKGTMVGQERLKNAEGVYIDAECSHCHASNGYDLAYFNYSNKSIEMRATFHGMTSQQGRDIAAYIRGLDSFESTNGRPWNPPFQPGDQIDTRANADHEWAAGQGLDAVLESDQAMFEDMFGSSNPTTGDIEGYIGGFTGDKNVRTQPISLQFPDWNDWLPTVAPIDIESEINPPGWSLTQYNNMVAAFDIATTQAENGSNLATTVDNTGPIVDGVGYWYSGNALFREVSLFIEAVSRNIRGNNTSQRYPSTSWAHTSEQNSRDIEIERKKRALSAWQSVRLFELIHSHNLHSITNYTEPLASEIETFQWPTRNWAVFQNAAHVISSRRGFSTFWENNDSAPGWTDAELRDVYNSSVWYQVQMTLTPGHRMGAITEPNDWAYNLMHVQTLSFASTLEEPARWLQNFTKAAEQRNNGLSPISELGWNNRELSPWRLIGSNARNNGEETILFNKLDDYTPGVKKKITSAYLNNVVAVLESFSESDWNRISRSEHEANSTPPKIRYLSLENANIDPDGSAWNGTSWNSQFIYASRGINGTDDQDAMEIDAAYSVLDFGSDGNTFDEISFEALKTWATSMWTGFGFANWPVWNGGTPGTSYAFTVIGGNDDGTEGGDMDGSYESGDVVNISANVPVGQNFVEWTSTGGGVFANSTDEVTTFTMPNNAVTVTATFETPPVGGAWPVSDNVITSVGHGDMNIWLRNPDDLLLSNDQAIDGVKWTATQPAGESYYFIVNPASGQILSINNDGTGVDSRNPGFTGSKAQFEVDENIAEGTFTLKSVFLFAGQPRYVSHAGGSLGVSTTAGPDEKWSVGGGEGPGAASIDAINVPGTITANNTFNVTVDASNVEGIILKLEQAPGDWITIDTDTSAPFEFTVNAPSVAGNYYLAAQATDAAGSAIPDAEIAILYLEIQVENGAVGPVIPAGLAYLVNRQTGRRIRPSGNSRNNIIENGSDGETGAFVEWDVVSAGELTVYLDNVSSGRRVYANGTDGGNLVQRGDGSTGNRYKWTMVPTDGQYFNLRNVFSDNYMSATGSGDGDNVIEVSSLNANWSQWYWEDAPGAARQVDSVIAEELVEAVELSVYPNPFTSQINIKGVNANARVVVYGIDGSQVFVGVGVSQIDLSDVMSGIYIIRVEDRAFRVIKR